MKRFLSAIIIWSLTMAVLMSLQGCLKDSCKNTYKIYAPVYKTLTQVRAEMKSGPARQPVNTGKIYVYGSYIFMNELQKGIHVIDNSNPVQPKNIAFISIPGNVDLAVKGNYLYADCYSDIAVFDITNPKQVSAVKFMDNVIKDYGYFYGNQVSPDSVNILVDYVSRDTTVDCDTWSGWMSCNSCLMLDAGGNVFMANTPSLASSPQGKGGSMARLCIVNDFMYGVSTSRIYSINIADQSNPQLVNDKVIAGGIETIYPFKDKLFIGSVSGMFVYDISNPANPNYISQFSHARSCDPVITDGNTAYVTLRSGTECQGFTNQMEVLDVSNLSTPVLLKTYPMTNPHGLSKENNLLFVCDGSSGFKVYDASNRMNIQLIKHFEQLETFDVITLDQLAIVVAKDGLYQYDFSNRENIRLISKIPISR